MKHVSASVLKRAASLVPGPSRPTVAGRAELLEEEQLVAKLRAGFRESGEDKAAYARRLGLTELQLTFLLRGGGRVSDRVAAALGYRKVIRFERVREDESRGAAFQTSE